MDRVDISTVISVGDNFNNRSTPDTLQLVTGKKYALVVDANNSTNMGNLSNEMKLEAYELKTNFADKNITVIPINKFTYITMEDGKFIDVGDSKNSYQAIVYWDGNLENDPQVQEGIHFSTEFIASQLNVQKESTYKIKTLKTRKKIQEVKQKGKFTANSQKVLDVLLQNYAAPRTAFVGDNQLVFNKDQSKVKAIKSFIKFPNKKEMLFEDILLNEKGQPIEVKQFEDDNELRSHIIFEYSQGKLVKIKSSLNESSIYYDDTQILETGNVGEADDVSLFWLQNGRLTKQTATLFLKDEFVYMNMFVEERANKDCYDTYINNELWEHICVTEPNIFPWKYSITSYQNGKVLQERKYRINEKSDQVYEIYFAGTDKKNDELMSTVTLNERGLISQLKNNGSESYTISTEYAYYP